MTNRGDPYVPVVLASLGVAAAPHFIFLPLWVTGLCVGIGLYTLAARYRLVPWPGRTGRLVLTVLGLATVLIGWGPAFDRQAAVALFLIMAALKPLEIACQRDRTVALFMGYLIVLTAVFATSNLAMGLYTVSATVVVTAALIHINHPAAPWHGHLRLAALFTVQAMPIMVVLFFAFPRIQGSLWSIARVPTARIGFSENLTLGDLGQLVSDRSIAFRAEFVGPPPLPQQRYWRGLVLTEYDGRTWRHGRKEPLKSPLTAVRESHPTPYTITLEPHGRHWLFALDLPLSAPPAAALFEDRTLVALRPVTETLRYRANSLLQDASGPRHPWSAATLAVDPASNPKAAALAQYWSRSAAGAREIVDRALAYFRDQGFVYSLKAPILNDRPLDAFLFDTRRGYCEHYAAALTFLLRAAGIPARIVIGYQGGEVNPLNGDLLVRQSDAHAWTEAWLPEQGWTRFDATAMAAPARLTAGAALSLPAGELTARGGLFSFGPVSHLARRLGYGWDAATAVWHRWVTGYSLERQQGLFKRLGIGEKKLSGLLVAAMSAVVLIAAMIWGYLQFARLIRRTPGGRVERTYRRFLQLAVQAGVTKAPHQGPKAFAAMAGRKRPDLQTEIDHITDLYVRLRYSPRGTSADLDRLSRSVARFRPRQRVTAEAAEAALGKE